MNGIKNLFGKALTEFGIDRLIADSDNIIVGFSGGADSRVLLSLLFDYISDSHKTLLCAHVNHMIRGEEADRDEKNCEIWADEYGIPIRVCRTNVPEIAERSGKGIEETAREERYKFFEELASVLPGKTLIATAHNADDNLETVIFNLLRGSGTRGMTGIPPVRDGKYIRPLILCSASSIRDYCIKNEIPYNVDNTNVNTDYTRNYIRNRIVPLLNTISNDPAQAALRMCSVLRTDDEYISSMADKYIQIHGNGKQLLSELSLLHDAVLSRVIDRLYRSAGGSRSLTKKHVDVVTDAIKNKTGSKKLNLPDGVVFSRSGNSVSFNKGNPTTDQKIRGNNPLTVDGDPFVFGDVAVAASTEPLKTLVINENIYNLSIHKKTEFDKIKCDFYVRGRTEGDRYRFGGSTRKVKKLFSEKKLSESEKEKVPLVCDNDGIVWIPGFPLRDGASSYPGVSDGCVYLCFYEKNRTI